MFEIFVNAKKTQANNGILEGLNSVVKAAKRKTRGYKLKHYRTIVYLITRDLDFSTLHLACLHNHLGEISEGVCSVLYSSTMTIL